MKMSNILFFKGHLSKVFYSFFALFIITVSGYFLWNKQAAKTNFYENIGDKEGPIPSKDDEFLRLRDPATNSIPENIFIRTNEFIKKLWADKKSLHKNENELLPGTWQSRGPNHFGGNTPALALDIFNENLILAGSSTGGIWKTTNGGEFWFKTITQPFDLKRVNKIVQDIRPTKRNIWYAVAGQDYVWLGVKTGEQGLFKSTDYGSTWTQLQSTSYLNRNFSITYNLVVDFTKIFGDVLYCALGGAIARSTDGGLTWKIVLGEATSSSYHDTDIIMTYNGTLYAAGDFINSKGIYRSVDGINWKKVSPAQFPTDLMNVILANSSSNPNAVYLLALSNQSSSLNGHLLGKYTYLSGDGSGSSGIFENKSQNLKAKVYQNSYGNIDSYGGYCLTLNVKPDDDNFVLAGGIELFRSRNGFSSTNNEAIGWGNYYLHSDMQSGVFSRKNPEIFYAGTDGGVFKTTEVSTDEKGKYYWPVHFYGINNSYFTGQFYTVTLAPEKGSDLIIGGTQDNGILGNASPGDTSGYQVSTGDGMIVQIAPPEEDIVYYEIDGGPLFRAKRNGYGVAVIHPSNSRKNAWMTYFVLDPNNSNYLYYAAGNSENISMIWRSSDAPHATRDYSWTPLSQTAVGTTSITAMDISKSNDPNVLYYGTYKGDIYKASDINSTPVVENITPAYLKEKPGGYLSCLSVDPRNSQTVLATFSNYNYKSLWFTSDGGKNWEDIEGNLGGANGPAIRSAKICHVNNHLYIFAGTEAGLFFTDSVNGTSTNWFMESEDLISNQSIRWLDYRESDQTLAVATFGRGLFTKTIQNTSAVNPVKIEVPKYSLLEQNYPNPFNPSTIIRYQLSKSSKVSIKVFDLNGREVATLVNSEKSAGKYETKFNGSNLSSGVYLYQMKADDFVDVKKFIIIK